MQVAVFQRTPNHRSAHQQHRQCGCSACQNETELSRDRDGSGPACGQTSKFLEALDTDIIILTANLADGADSVSPVVMAKLIDNPVTVLVIYAEVSPMWDALAPVLETP